MKLATSPLKGKPRRMRVDREERLAFVRRLLTRPSEFRAVNFFIIQSIHFSISNNAIKKSPCRYFLFCSDIFVEILIFTRYVWHHFGFGILLKEKGYVKHVVKHASIYRDHFLRHYFFGSFTFFSIHPIRHSTTSTLPLTIIKMSY